MQSDGSWMEATDVGFASNSAASKGGCIFILASSPGVITAALERVKFDGCLSDADSSDGEGGGGIFVQNGDVSMRDCHMHDCKSVGPGGGLYVVKGVLSIIGM